MTDAGSLDQRLLEQAASGDHSASQRLLGLHRRRLRAMIALRLDRRLSARVDPSDVLQEALAEAYRKLPEYARTQPIPLYPWLRQIAWEKIVHLHRQHLLAQARAVTREEQFSIPLPDDSVLDLGRRLVASSSNPSQRMLHDELRARVRAALERLEPKDREVLVLRFLEQLTVDETAAALQLSSEAVKSRQRRALERFGDIVGGAFSGDLP